MTKSKSTKRALLSSVLALVLTCTMLLGTTFAWFTDSVKSGANKIIAGNLDVELEYATVGDDGTLQNWTSVESKTNLFKQDTLWEPGHAEVVYLRVRNAGTLALKYKLAMTIPLEKSGTNVAGEDFKLSQYLKYGVVEDRDTAFADRADAIAAVTNPTALSEYNKDITSLEAGTSDYVALVVYMPETVGNEANYKTGTRAPQIYLGIKLIATQYTFEEDSWDNQYDKDAPLDFVTVASFAEINNVLGKAGTGETVNLKFKNDITVPTFEVGGVIYHPQILDKDKATNRDVNVILDGDGYTLTVPTNGTEAPLIKLDGVATVKNLTIDGPVGQALYIESPRDVVLENVTIKLNDTSKTAYPLYVFGGGTITMNDCNIIGRTGLFHPSLAYTEATMGIGNGIRLTVNGGNIDSIFVNAGTTGDPNGSDGRLTINRGHIGKVILETDFVGDDKYVSAKLINNGGTVDEIVNNPQNLDLTGRTEVNPLN